MNPKRKNKFGGLISGTLLLLALVFVPATFAFAQGIGATEVPAAGSQGATEVPQQTFTLTNPLKATSIGQVVLDFTTIFSYVVILIAVLCLIWVGFQYVLASAQGNSSKIKELHGYLLYIVIGIAVVIGARVIVQVVFNTLQATGTVNSNVTQSVNQALQ